MGNPARSGFMSAGHAEAPNGNLRAVIQGWPTTTEVGRPGDDDWVRRVTPGDGNSFSQRPVAGRCTARLALAALVGAILVPPLASAQGVGRAESAVGELRRLGAAPLEASLAGIDRQWQFRFRTADRDEIVAAEDVVSWGKCMEAARGPAIVLADGSLVIGDLASSTRENLVVDAGCFGQLSLPLDLVAAVVVRMPAAPLERDQLLDLVARGSGVTDRVLLTNGDEIAGTIAAIQEGKVQIDAGSSSVQAETARIRGLVYNPALRRRLESRGRRAWLGFRDGSRLLAESATFDGKVLEATLAAGLKVTAQGEPPVFLQPLGGKIVYLSDLEPVAYRHVPYLSLSWPFHADRNAMGGMLRAGGRLFLKGIGMHSASRLSYEVGEPMQRLEAELALDDQMAGRGSVRYRVFVDGALRYTSPLVRGGASPVAARVDLGQAKRIDLVVDFAERADEADCADWIDARLIR